MLAAMALREAFLSALPTPLRPAFEALPDLELALARLVARAPACAPAELVRALAPHLEADAATDPAAALAATHVEDLALAQRCAAGDESALAAFDARFAADVDRALRKSKGLGVSADEFRQIVREKLFVAAPGGAPRVASYGGRAPLAGWLRVVCARAVIDLVRRGEDERPAGDGGALLERLSGKDDPELSALRARYAAILPKAFRAGLRALAPRQRNLLRQRYLHDVPAAALANSYGVHRATLFAWLDEARAALLEHTRRAVRAEIRDVELESVVRLMGSELELSLRQLMTPEGEPESAAG